MHKLRNNQSGSHVIMIAVVLLVIGAIGFVAYRVASNKKDDTPPNESHQSSTPKQTTDTPEVAWQAGADGTWVTVGNVKPPACPDPFSMQLPIEISKVESVLYPGQQRSTGYKPHGGLKLKGNSNDVEVRAPFDAKLVSGSRYIEAGEVQYILFFVHPCGMAYRLDHLLRLPANIQALADTLPGPQVDDSRTTNFSSPKEVKKGEVVATAAGHTGNTAFDLGVYDLRKRNEASQNTAYASAHQAEGGQTFYALCWLDLMPEKAQLKALPSTDMNMGKQSDYCN